ncbi:MAG TPA: hypothetical protein VG387_15630 [Rhizomicrobium sp.]|jgi:hypothetical protein|nr:hypothetical protein [Rhizomicrobium sp.]
MVERTTSPYARLFEVRLLHHYWLDTGKTMFDALPAAGQAERLLTYDVRPILTVVPTAPTATLLMGLGCIFRPTGMGFIVALPAGRAIPVDTVLGFVVTVADGGLFGYTALSLLPRDVYEVFDPTDTSPGRVTYRYKANVPLLSNLTGATRGTALYLSQEIPAPAATDPAEALVQSAGALLQLTSDNPAATTQQIGAPASSLPVFVNQADMPAIAPPAGVTGAPAFGVELSGGIPDDAFLVISLTAVRGDNDAFSFVDNTGAPKPAAPVYQVRFKNRSTVWTYLDKGTGAVTATEPAPLPLTYFGNAGAGQAPSRGIVKPVRSGAKITQLVSEIYV